MPEIDCLACSRDVPKRGRRRCPWCGYVFRGSGWDGIDAHWRAKHQDVMPYEDFRASLCPPHRRRGDRASGFLPLGKP